MITQNGVTAFPMREFFLTLGGGDRLTGGVEPTDGLACFDRAASVLSVVRFLSCLSCFQLP
jgi:hypothetical protein